MEPPRHVCESLAKIHPLLRIGWDGEDGKFGLLMVTRSRLAKRTYYEYWRGRGPVYSCKGRPRADWDEIGHVPMYLIDLEPEDVYSGRVCRLARQWTRPMAARYVESAQQAGLDVESDVESKAHEAGLDLYRRAQKDNAGAPIVAKKFIKPTDNQTNVRSGRFDHTNRFLPETIPEGWQKQIDMDEGDPDDLGSI